MTNLTTDIVTTLNLLLPGFIAAWVFYGLTAYLRPSPFERIIQALVYNIILRPFVLAIGAMLQFAGKWYSLRPWTVESELTTAVILAFPLGAVVAGFANSDVVHRWLRERDGLLQRVDPYALRNWIWTWNNAFPSEWYSALSRRGQYVVLHLADGRRLYGWPDEFPDDPTSGHFVLSEAEWLVERNVEYARVPLEGVESIMVRGSDIEMVEFMEQRMTNHEK